MVTIEYAIKGATTEATNDTKNQDTTKKFKTEFSVLESLERRTEDLNLV